MTLKELIKKWEAELNAANSSVDRLAAKGQYETACRYQEDARWIERFVEDLKKLEEKESVN